MTMLEIDAHMLAAYAGLGGDRTPLQVYATLHDGNTLERNSLQEALEEALMLDYAAAIPGKWNVTVADKRGVKLRVVDTIETAICADAATLFRQPTGDDRRRGLFLAAAAAELADTLVGTCVLLGTPLQVVSARRDGAAGFVLAAPYTALASAIATRQPPKPTERDPAGLFAAMSWRLGGDLRDATPDQIAAAKDWVKTRRAARACEVAYLCATERLVATGVTADTIVAGVGIIRCTETTIQSHTVKQHQRRTLSLVEEE